MLKTNIWAKIFICEKETDEDRADHDYIDNCEVDDICNDYKNRYYVAQITTKKIGNQTSEKIKKINFEYNEMLKNSVQVN